MPKTGEDPLMVLTCLEVTVHSVVIAANGMMSSQRKPLSSAAENLHMTECFQAQNHRTASTCLGCLAAKR